MPWKEKSSKPSFTIRRAREIIRQAKANPTRWDGFIVEEARLIVHRNKQRNNPKPKRPPKHKRIP